MARLLLIEDERDIAQVLEFNLRQAGYEVRWTTRGQEGIRLASEGVELILLDLMLPDLPGTEVCRRLKADKATRAIPIVILTAKGEEVDRIVGFELGADDYITKPFSLRELLLRVAAILRRSQERGAATDDVVEFGPLRVEVGAHRAVVEGKPVDLTALEFKLLVLLLTRRGRVQTRAGLLDEVWGIQAAVTTRTVDTHVKRLRHKLGDVGAAIQTVRGVGYRFAEAPELVAREPTLDDDSELGEE